MIKSYTCFLRCLFFTALIGSFLSSFSRQSDGVPDTYHNPIIRGMAPDPSICRAGEYYYLVNSSFEWYPGLPIYKSKDLVNWELIGHGFNNRDHNFIKPGTFDSGGLFAPTIRYHDGLFYIINTHIGGKGNFYITATDPAGPWSEPVWIDAPGIDPSLFWDDDGKCYYIGNGNLSGVKQWYGQAGVWMQELDLKSKKLIGKRKQLTFGHATNARWGEGPHLYKIKGKYVLLMSEGGTDIDHAVTCFVSDSIWGEYEPIQINPILTHRHLGTEYPVYATGHADIVQTPQGEWWMVALGKRRGAGGECYIGRETFLAPLQIEEFTDVNGKESLRFIVSPGEGRLPVVGKRPDLEWTPVRSAGDTDSFDNDKLALDWCFLRTPMTDWYSLSNGKLFMKLRSEVASDFVNPSMIVKRVKEHKFKASALMSFTSHNPNEEAGVILYRSSKYYVTFTVKNGCAVVTSYDGGAKRTLTERQIKPGPVSLSIVSDGKQLSFIVNDDTPYTMKCRISLEIVSDKFQRSGGYGGTMVGMYATSNGIYSTSIVEFDTFTLVYGDIFKTSN